MAKNFDLTINNDLTERLSNDQLPVQAFLADLFNDEKSNAIIRERLASYFYDDGGSPEVRDFEVIDATFDKNSLTGTFKCNFRVYYFFTCSDVKNEKKENITWTFKIDSKNLIIAFTGEEPWVIE